MGTKRENVTLGLVPSIPKYDGFKYINNILYTDWLVKSHQELTSIQILFRNNEVSQAERASSSIILMAQLSMTEHLFLKSPDDIIILLHFYLLNSFFFCCRKCGIQRTQQLRENIKRASLMNGSKLLSQNCV